MRALILLFSLACLALPANAAETLRVAVATSVQPALADIGAAFKRKTGIDIAATGGASGKLAAAIEQGATYDLFLSADMTWPRAVIAAGLASGEPVPYARGGLVAWMTGDQPVADWQRRILSSSLQRVVIADPDVSPYGREAQGALEALGLRVRTRAKVVLLPDSAQVAQEIIAGKAELAIAARASTFAPASRGIGKWVDLPRDSYTPLEHGALILDAGAKRAPAATSQLLDFITSPAGRDILRRHGFDLP